MSLAYAVEPDGLTHRLMHCEEWEVISVGGAVLRLDDHKCTAEFADDRVTSLALAQTRALLRRNPNLSLSVRNHDFDVAAYSNLSGLEAEMLLSGYIFGLEECVSRFIQWECELPRSQPRALRRLLRAYRQGAALERILELVNEELETPRFIQYRYDLDKLDVVVVHASPSLRDGNTGWFERSAGRSFLRGFPDPEYARWTAHGYSDAIIERRAPIHRVTIDLMYPTNATSRHDYHRIIMPFWGSSLGHVDLIVVMKDVEFDRALLGL